MSRTSKKILYGILYGILFFLIFRGVYHALFTPRTVCLECGGAQGIPDTIHDPLRVEGNVSMFTSVPGRVVIFAKVLNPNTLYSARPLSYIFHVLDSQGQSLQDVEGEITINASTETYLFGAFETTRRPSDIGSVSLELKDPTWSSVGDFARPSISLPLDIKTLNDGNVITVTGTLKNQGLIDAPNVQIIALLHDRSEFHDPLFAGVAFVRISNMSESLFTVTFPNDKGLSSALDPELTEVFTHVE